MKFTPWACMVPEEEGSGTETESCTRWTSSLGPSVGESLSDDGKHFITILLVTYTLLWPAVGLVSRQSIRLHGGLHRQHQRPGGRGALLRCGLHLHHFPASHAARRGEGIHQDPEEWGRPGAQEETPEERQAAPTDADGLWPSGRPLSKPHHPRPGKNWEIHPSIWENAYILKYTLLKRKVYSVWQVADAEKNTEICDIMMSRYNIYVQAINYPTVAKGEELLRIAPTPHHTPQMMNYFVGMPTIVIVFNPLYPQIQFFYALDKQCIHFKTQVSEYDYTNFDWFIHTLLRVYPHLLDLCSASTEQLAKTWTEVGMELRPHPSAECNFCQQPLHFELMSEREKSYFTGLSHMVSAVAWCQPENHSSIQAIYFYLNEIHHHIYI